MPTVFKAREKNGIEEQHYNGRRKTRLTPVAFNGTPMTYNPVSGSSRSSIYPRNGASSTKHTTDIFLFSSFLTFKILSQLNWLSSIKTETFSKKNSEFSSVVPSSNNNNNTKMTLHRVPTTKQFTEPATTWKHGKSIRVAQQMGRPNNTLFTGMIQRFFLLK